MLNLDARKSIHVYGAGYLFVIFFLYLSVSLGTPICSGDCSGYIELMGLDWKAYLPKAYHIYRGWGIPAFYSLFGSYSLYSASNIVLAQTTLLFLAWVFFAYSCQTLIANHIMKAVTFVAVTSLMFGQGYYRLNQFLLSDTMGLASVLTQLALCVLLPVKIKEYRQAPNGNPAIIIHVVALVLVSAFEMATRDANISLAIAGMFFAFFYSWKEFDNKKLRNIAVIVFVVLALAQVISANNRHRQAAKDILAAVVLPNEEIRNFFLDHGMPPELAEAGKIMPPQDLGNINSDETMASRRIVAAINKNYPRKASKLYALYLIAHPMYVVTNTLKYEDLIFEQNYLSEYPTSASDQTMVGLDEKAPFIMPPLLDLSLADYIPMGGKLVVILVYAAVCVWRLRHLNVWMMLPLLIAGLGAGNAIMGFFGEAWQRNEMLRHAFIGSVIFRIGCVLCAIYLAEEVRMRISQRIATKD